MRDKLRGAKANLIVMDEIGNVRPLKHDDQVDAYNYMFNAVDRVYSSGTMIRRMTSNTPAIVNIPRSVGKSAMMGAMYGAGAKSLSYWSDLWKIWKSYKATLCVNSDGVMFECGKYKYRYTYKTKRKEFVPAKYMTAKIMLDAVAENGHANIEGIGVMRTTLVGRTYEFAF